MKLLDSNGKNIEKVDLGIVEAGKNKDYTFQVANETSAEVIDIKVEVTDKEVKVLDFSKTIEPNSKGFIKLNWSPSVTVKKGLQTVIKLTGTELWR